MANLGTGVEERTTDWRKDDTDDEEEWENCLWCEDWPGG